MVLFFWIWQFGTMYCIIICFYQIFHVIYCASLEFCYKLSHSPHLSIHINYYFSWILLYISSYWACSQSPERIMIRKPFRIMIHFLIGFVIWTTCVHKHSQLPSPITNRICALHCEVINILHIQKHRSERALHSQVIRIRLSIGRSRSKTPLFSHFKSLIWKNFAFTKGKIRLFRSGKGQNHDPKWLSERDSHLCEQARCP